MAKGTDKYADRVRYHAGRQAALAAMVSISARGSMTISADLAKHLPDYILLWAEPSKGTKTTVYIEPAKPDTPDSIKAPTDVGSGSRRVNVAAAVRQFGLNEIEGTRRCPAKWVDGEVVVDLARAEIVRIPKRSSARAPRESASVWVGRRTCAECGKEVPYREVAGRCVLRSHRDPDGVPCQGGHD